VFGIAFTFFERLFSDKTDKHLQDEFLNSCKTGVKGSVFKSVSVSKQSDTLWLKDLESYIKKRRQSSGEEPQMEQQLKKALIEFMHKSLSGIRKSDNDVSESLLQCLADSLYTNILYWNNDHEGFLEYKSKQQVFHKPIVLKANKENVKIFYTKSQALCFANEEDKVIFREDDYKNVVNEVFNLLDDLLTRTSKFLTSVNDFLKTKKTSEVKEALCSLFNAEFKHSNIRENELLKKSIQDFNMRIEKHRACFDNEKALVEGFDSLKNNVVDPYEFGGSKAGKCAKCSSHCKPYKAYQFVCGHILHEECFEK
jgi:hypothetical protein